MIRYRTYKYLIKPTASQKEIIKQTLLCCTYVFNKYIEENGNVTYQYYKAKDILNKYKSENETLNSVDSSALMNVLFKLQYNRKFDLIHLKKECVRSYTTTNLSGRQGIYLINDKYINVPKLGSISIVLHRPLPLNASIKNVTISIDILGDYYISISFSFEDNKPPLTLDINKVIGLDYSSKHLYVDSNGDRCEEKHFLLKQEDKLSKLKQGLQRCRKNSINYYKLKDKIGKLYKKTYNQRIDYLHKLSTKLANEYDIVCIEDLDMNEIAGNYNLGKYTYDNSYGTFIELLKYKLEDRGKVLIKIDKYYPSSKTCHICGYVNNMLQISDKSWTCLHCNTVHDRDINAAINIKEKGIEEFTSIGYLENAYENKKHTTLNQRHKECW